jgi:cobalamin biosynthesis protein CobW
LPQPLVQAFNWPEVKSRVSVDGVVVVIDASAVAAGRFADDPAALEAQRAADPALDHDNPLEEVFTDQLACADLVILNKTDLLDEAGREDVRRTVAERLRPVVKLIEASHGKVSITVLLGLDAAAENDLANRPSHLDVEGEHDHDDFESFVVERGPVGDTPLFLHRLGEAVAAHDILRLKGFLAVPGKELRQVIQGVGSRIQHYFDRPWAVGETRASRLVVIGRKGLDRAAIATAIQA